MRALKPGDRVRINNKYGIEKKYEGRIFIVASEPWTVGSMQLVKLQGERGAVRVDTIENINDVYVEHLRSIISELKKFCDEQDACKECPIFFKGCKGRFISF